MSEEKYLNEDGSHMAEAIIEKMFDEENIEYNGHYSWLRKNKTKEERIEILKESFLNRIVLELNYGKFFGVDSFVSLQISPDDLVELKEPLKQKVVLSNTISKCPDCGKYMYILTDGMKLYFASRGFAENGEIVYNGCDYPDGFPETYSGHISIPTGRVVCQDTIPVDNEELNNWNDYDVNTHLGTMQAFMHTIPHNVAHGYCGNSCPGVFRSKDGKKMVVGKGETDPETYESKPLDLGDGVEYERVGSICTDLWWYTILDKSLATDLERADCEFDCEPGKWKVTHHRQLNDEWHEQRIYAVLEWEE